MQSKESILKKIRGLMQKTVENGCTEAEAIAAAEMVDRLMQEYEVQMSDLQFQEQVCDKLEIFTGGDKGHSVEYAMENIAHFTDTKCWKSSRYDGLYYCWFGMEKDLEIAEYLYYLVRRSADRAMKLYAFSDQDHAYAKKGEKRVSKESFGIGMCSRIGERLRELKIARQANMAESTGRDLVVVKNAIVDDAFAALDLKLGKARGGKIGNRGAYMKGVVAGDKVQLSDGIRSYARRNAQIT